MKSLIYVFVTFWLTISVNAYESVPDVDGLDVTAKGKIVKAKNRYFIMKHSNGDKMVVEMDDWDWYAEGKHLKEGDEVVVYGEVDTDFPESKKIEAGSVYVKNLGTYFYANSTDEEDYPEWHDYHYSRITYAMPTEKMYIGEVTDVSNKSFIIKQSNDKKIRISIKDLSYNPLDNLGFQKIQVGDRVAVAGELKDRIFTIDKVMADAVITLREDNSNNTAMN